MPVHSCQINGKSGYKWGDQGKCYPYNSESNVSKEHAKKKAIAQGIAIGDFGNFKLAESYNDYPQAASDNAKKALDWIDKYGRKEVQAGTLVGLARANQLANKENITRDTIARMASFDRHRENSNIADEFKGTPWKDKGYVAWLLWGGTEGIEWAKRKLKQIDEQKFEGTKISFDYDETLTRSDIQDKAINYIKNNDLVYIISARHKVEGMYAMADKLGIPHSRVYATGSNKNKIEKVKELGIKYHYDNNKAVIKLLKEKGKLV